MTAKLTLSVDSDVIEAAKRYAAATGTSVSQLVEAYLSTIVAPQAPSTTPPILARLRGSMQGVSIDEHHEHLAAKYLR